MHKAAIHFDLAKSKMGEQVEHQMNLGKATDDHTNRDILVDWKKEIMEELARLMSEKNLITMDLAALVICCVNKSPFVDWNMAEPKLKDFTSPVFKIVEGNSNPIECISQFQQKMALERNNEGILCKFFSTTLTGPTLIWFCQLPENRLTILRLSIVIL